MDEFSDDKLRMLQRLFQQAALDGFPNPKREGCPGLKVLEEVAGSRAAFHHPAYEHVKRCSPCLKEMLDLRRAKLNAAKRRRKAVYIGVIAAVAALFAITIWVNRGSRTPADTVDRRLLSAERSLSITMAKPTESSESRLFWPVNLSGISRTRGSGQLKEISPIRIPPRLLNLQVTLPFGSDDGQYQFEIRGGVRVVKQLSGRARIQNGDTLLDVLHVDLTQVPQGPYELFFKHADASWQDVPITIESSANDH